MPSAIVSSIACETHGQLEPLGERGPEDGADRLLPLLAEEDEIRLLARDRLREHACRGEQIGAGERVVGDEHGAVGAERERAAQRLGGALRTHRDDDDLAAARGVALAQPLLDRVHVEGVERKLAGAVETLALRVEAPRRGGLGHLLHADSDLHIGGTLPTAR